mmetsp:Transcript_18873/g.34632  ORF Transcript_18873/g.34632 Transcript_18873/m.34632 type:complete len:346 (-) Transcript_18873:47-1084(-)
MIGSAQFNSGVALPRAPKESAVPKDACSAGLPMLCHHEREASLKALLKTPMLPRRSASTPSLGNALFSSRGSFGGLSTVQREETPRHLRIRNRLCAHLPAEDSKRCSPWRKTKQASFHTLTCEHGEAKQRGDTSKSPSSCRRNNFLLPPETKNLLCNWSGCGEGKLHMLIQSLRELWGSDATEPKTFYDLGCGDGRVALAVCRAFPACSCVGVDLNKQLVQEAEMQARQAGLQDRCKFQVDDITKACLSDAAVIFLYFPPGALRAILRRVIGGSSLRQGTTIYTADAPLWQPVTTLFKGGCKFCAEEEGLYRYVWCGEVFTKEGTLPCERDGRAAHRTGLRVWSL